MNDITVSIITVCYNSEQTIESTIQSVLNQTYSNIEYIIIDGNSADGTLDIIEKYKESFGEKLIVVSEKDDGIYDAMNKGIRLASGELIGIINSDDYYEKNAVEVIVNAHQKNKENNILAVYYGGTAMVSDGAVKRIEYSNHEKLEESMITHPSCFVTSKTYEELGCFDVQYCCVADYDFMLRAKKSGKVLFVPISEPIANFSLGGTCSTSKAYIDLLQLKINYGMMSYFEGNIEIMKAKLAEGMKKRNMKPIRLRKR